METSTVFSMINQELSSIFEDLADMEEIDGNRWESLAYRKVSISISLLSEDIVEIYRRGQLRNVEGVGSAIEKKIIEYIESGKIQKHEELKQKYNIDFTSLRKIQGLGPKKIAALYNSLGIKNLDELIDAIKSDRVSTIPGFGKKSQESLAKSIEIFLTTGANRKPIAFCYDFIEAFLDKLRRSGKFTQIELAGSARRMKDTIGDIDILASSNDSATAADYFVSMDEIKHVIAKGDTKSAVLLSLGLNCDLRIIDEDSFGAALQYFTGSKEHNIRLRDIAISKGLKLNEYGLYRGKQSIAGFTEEGIYHNLDLDWVPPELRENMGEIEAAMERNLPTIIPYDKVKGDFHVHTNASDGHSSLKEMIAAAEVLEYDFVAITEHSKSLKVANGLDEERFSKRNREIDAINEAGNHIRILKGVELEILRDGTLDLSRSMLEEMDVVVGALHQAVSDNIDTNTGRLVKAIESGLITILAHPTGRLIGSREAYRIDFEKIFQSCEDNGVALEINGFPTRSDLPFDLVKKASGYKVNFALGSDSHDVSQLKYLRYATAIARRGWLEENRVINVESWERK